MKALIKKEAKRGIWMGEVEKPTISQTEVLIKIKKTAICGTDVHIYQWDEWAQKTIPVPMHVGHEFVGEIVEIGSEVTGLKIGERVSGEGHIVCGYCRNCRAGTRHLCAHTKGIGVNLPGAFAEFLKMPATNVFPIPKGITDDEAAILDPLGNAVHTALSFDVVGEDVLITGAGPIGIMAAAVCKHVGAKNVAITDINPFRLQLAKKLGIKTTVDSSQKSLKEVMKDLEMKEGFDVGLEMSGNEKALNGMLEVMRPGGKIALLGILPDNTKVNFEAIIFKGLWLKGIFGREIFETWYKMSAMLRSGLNIDEIFTHQFPVAEYEQAFEIMCSGKAGKIILNWD